MSSRQRSCKSLQQHLTTYTKSPDSYTSIDYMLHTLNLLRTWIKSLVQDKSPIQNYYAAIYVWVWYTIHHQRRHGNNNECNQRESESRDKNSNGVCVPERCNKKHVERRRRGIEPLHVSMLCKLKSRPSTSTIQSGWSEWSCRGAMFSVLGS